MTPAAMGAAALVPPKRDVHSPSGSVVLYRLCVCVCRLCEEARKERMEEGLEGKLQGMHEQMKKRKRNTSFRPKSSSTHH